MTAAAKQFSSGNIGVTSLEHKKRNIMDENNNAIIILHEIYGVNEFIQNQCREFTKAGFTVFSPNLLKRGSFAYEASAEAYNFFFENVGFHVYTEINALIHQLKKQYRSVFVLGFSVGATLAWSCCENSSCSGIIAFYGSRIRDFTELNPTCPTFLAFASEDSFDVEKVAKKLNAKPDLSVFQYEAKHGFYDCCSPNYDDVEAAKAKGDMTRFIKQVCGNEEEKR